MMIRGDLLDLADQGEFDIIVHSCNCFHSMDTGLSKRIKDRYTGVQAADKNTSYGSASKLGSYSISIDPKSGLTIVNAYTHYACSSDNHSELLVDYVAFKNVLYWLEHDFVGQRIGIPLFHWGLGCDTIRIFTVLSDFEARISKTGGSLIIIFESVS